MKAVLEFELDNPDDKMAHLRCVKSLDMALFIWDVRELLNKELKPNELNRKLSDLFEHYNIVIYELIN